MCLRHEAVRVEDAEDGDGGGQEDAEHLGDEVRDETELFAENSAVKIGAKHKMTQSY